MIKVNPKVFKGMGEPSEYAKEVIARHSVKGLGDVTKYKRRTMNNKYQKALELYRDNYHDITVALIIEELSNDMYRDRIVEQIRNRCVKDIKCDDYTLERLSEYLYYKFMKSDNLHPCDEYFLDEYLSEAVDVYIKYMTL